MIFDVLAIDIVFARIDRQAKLIKLDGITLKSTLAIKPIGHLCSNGFNRIKILLAVFILHCLKGQKMVHPGWDHFFTINKFFGLQLINQGIGF